MNCEQGDLAVVIRADNQQNVGRIVLVLRHGPVNDSWIVRHHGRPAITRFGPCWEPWAYDSELRPLRDRPGKDETLTWAGKPEKVIA